MTILSNQRQPNTLGARITTLRMGRGWRQSDLAAELGGTTRRSSVANWERGIVTPTAASLFALAEALETTVEYLWGGVGEP